MTIRTSIVSFSDSCFASGAWICLSTQTSDAEASLWNAESTDADFWMAGRMTTSRSLGPACALVTGLEPTVWNLQMQHDILLSSSSYRDDPNDIFFTLCACSWGKSTAAVVRLFCMKIKQNKAQNLENKALLGKINDFLIKLSMYKFIYFFITTLKHHHLFVIFSHSKTFNSMMPPGFGWNCFGNSPQSNWIWKNYLPFINLYQKTLMDFF